MRTPGGLQVDSGWTPYGLRSTPVHSAWSPPGVRAEYADSARSRWVTAKFCSRRALVVCVNRSQIPNGVSSPPDPPRSENQPIHPRDPPRSVDPGTSSLGLTHSRRRPIRLLARGTNSQARYSKEPPCQRAFFTESSVGDHGKSLPEGSHQDREASITTDWQKGG